MPIGSFVKKFYEDQFRLTINSPLCQPSKIELPESVTAVVINIPLENFDEFGHGRSRVVFHIN